MIEYTILQQAIYNNHEVLAEIDPFYFSDKKLKDICKYIADTYIQNETINFDLLRAAVNADKYQMQRRAILDIIGEIEEGVYGYNDDSIQDLKDTYKLREGKLLASKLLKAGTDECTVEDIYRLIENYQGVLTCGKENADGKLFTDLKETILNEPLESLQAKRVYFNRTGIRELLPYIWGDHLKQRQYLVSGKSQSGKNILVDNMVCDFSMQGEHGIYFSFDNSAGDTANSIISCANEIDYSTIENRMFTKEQRSQIMLNDFNIKIFDSVTDVYGIQNILRKNKQASYFVLDYFTCIHVRKGNPVMEYARSAQLLKQFCNDFDMVGIIVSQLNNDNEIAWCKELHKSCFHNLRVDRIPDGQGNIDLEDTNRNAVVVKYKTGKPKVVKWDFNPCTKRIYIKE